MRDHLHLFILMLHFSTGCIVSNEQQTVEITGYTGASVVLPCSCADPQSTATTFIWEFQDSENRWIPVFEDEKYRGRSVLFNERSPTNRSLLISDLRMNDQGYYSCKTEPNIITYVNLKVKGCDLVENRKTVAVSGYSGESVVLPCSCTELLTKPEQIKWTYFVENEYKEIYPNHQIESHKNRVKLFNPNTPGNLSLQISALTTDDQGVYQCFVSSQQLVAFRLTVLHAEGKPHVATISLTTHQPSHQTQDSSTTSEHQPTPQQNIPPYVFILLGVFFSVLLLALLAFIGWRCRGGRNDKKAITHAEEQKREQDNQDDVTYSAVVHVKTPSKPAHTHNDPEEFTEYARINVKR
ncbi:V-set and immunoglobulin domain-containing protein 1 [Garra rufa]|uniref:V-set and immunoglobulin domain-containing protein 1 n=1 Tax=Garra rufa TaxID=137080 RepID=UPI003CCEF40C